jgi:hypothetical protein
MATEAQQSSNWPMSIFLDTMKVHKIKTKTKRFLGQNWSLLGITQ